MTNSLMSAHARLVIQVGGQPPSSRFASKSKLAKVLPALLGRCASSCQDASLMNWATAHAATAALSPKELERWFSHLD